MDTTASKPLGRNEPCHCQSGKKYKQCCLDKDEAAARKAREEARASAAAAAPAEAPAQDDDKPVPGKPQGRLHHAKSDRPGVNSRGFQKATGTPRKVGGG